MSQNEIKQNKRRPTSLCPKSKISLTGEKALNHPPTLIDNDVTKDILSTPFLNKLLELPSQKNNEMNQTNNINTNISVNSSAVISAVSSSSNTFVNTVSPITPMTTKELLNQYGTTKSLTIDQVQAESLFRQQLNRIKASESKNETSDNSQSATSTASITQPVLIKENAQQQDAPPVTTCSTSKPASLVKLDSSSHSTTSSSTASVHSDDISGGVRCAAPRYAKNSNVPDSSTSAGGVASGSALPLSPARPLHSSSMPPSAAAPPPPHQHHHSQSGTQALLATQMAVSSSSAGTSRGGTTGRGGAASARGGATSSISSAAVGGGVGGGGVKLDRKRARNRDAARKCRERKIRLISSLEKDMGGLETDNFSLLKQLKEQQQEISQLMETFHRHRASGCNMIASSTCSSSGGLGGAGGGDDLGVQLDQQYAELEQRAAQIETKISEAIRVRDRDLAERNAAAEEERRREEEEEDMEMEMERDNCWEELTTNADEEEDLEQSEQQQRQQLNDSNSTNSRGGRAARSRSARKSVSKNSHK